eukprot:Seg4756.3 transcript_id=Seg4756.3/GoldUCD/mRNA.D3Y31 product="hypothetical protein" protein_id=Seg4756.3/GoldUCD/D3Y31
MLHIAATIHRNAHLHYTTVIAVERSISLPNNSFQHQIHTCVCASQHLSLKTDCISIINKMARFIKVNLYGSIKYIYYDQRERLGILKKEVGRKFNIDPSEEFHFTNYKGERLRKISHCTILYINITGKNTKHEHKETAPHHKNQQQNQNQQQISKKRQRSEDDPDEPQTKTKIHKKQSETINLKDRSVINLTINFST